MDPHNITSDLLGISHMTSIEREITDYYLKDCIYD